MNTDDYRFFKGSVETAKYRTDDTWTTSESSRETENKRLDRLRMNRKRCFLTSWWPTRGHIYTAVLALVNHTSWQFWICCCTATPLFVPCPNSKRRSPNTTVGCSRKRFYWYAITWLVLPVLNLSLLAKLAWNSLSCFYVDLTHSYGQEIIHR